MPSERTKELVTIILVDALVASFHGKVVDDILDCRAALLSHYADLESEIERLRGLVR